MTSTFSILIKLPFRFVDSPGRITRPFCDGEGTRGIIAQDIQEYQACNLMGDEDFIENFNGCDY